MSGMDLAAALGLVGFMLYLVLMPVTWILFSVVLFHVGDIKGEAFHSVWFGFLLSFGWPVSIIGGAMIWLLKGQKEKSV